MGDRIIEARENVGINQSQLARRGGWAITTVHSWERADKTQRKHPSDDNLAKVAQITGRTVAELKGEPSDARVVFDVHPELEALREVMEMTDEEFQRLAAMDMRGLNPTQATYLWHLQGIRSTPRAPDNDVTAEAEESARARGGRKLR